jgi:hypothetical protein
LLRGCPQERITSLENFCRHNNVPESDLEAQLASWEGAGHFKQLLCDVNVPRRGNQHPKQLRASGCFLLSGHDEKSTAVEESVEYYECDTLGYNARFREQQQEGIGCLKVKVSHKATSKEEREDPERGPTLRAKLRLHAVALLHWRLQNVQDLPLGWVLAGMVEQQKAATAAAAQSDARRALCGFELGM